MQWKEVKKYKRAIQGHELKIKTHTTLIHSLYISSSLVCMCVCVCKSSTRTWSRLANWSRKHWNLNKLSKCPWDTLSKWQTAASKYVFGLVLTHPLPFAERVFRETGQEEQEEQEQRREEEKGTKADAERWNNNTIATVATCCTALLYLPTHFLCLWLVGR